MGRDDGRGCRLSMRIVGLAVVVFVGIIVWSGWWVSAELARQGPLSHGTDVIIAPGMHSRSIADHLAQRGVIDHPFVFVLAVMVLRQEAYLQAGGYTIPARASIRHVIDILVQGRQKLYRLTVPEGISVYQAKAILAGMDNLTGPISTDIAEGSLFPDTYFYPLSYPRQKLIHVMERRMQSTLERLWVSRDRQLPFADPMDGLILASIVEKETAKLSERSKVASVFINRLRLGMRLQSDPTAIYALKQLGQWQDGQRLLRKDLKVDSRFNTYRYGGLPPAPICLPSLSSLEAVFHPNWGDSLYFVADGKGGHVFSRSLSEHNRHVRALRRYQKKHGQR